MDCRNAGEIVVLIGNYSMGYRVWKSLLGLKYSLKSLGGKSPGGSGTARWIIENISLCKIVI